MNSWNIPLELEEEIIERDTKCVYCRVTFTSIEVSRKSSPSWEHIINDASIITRENIARCCVSCNASKGAKELSVWLESKYCRDRDITKNSVAEAVRNTLENLPI